MSDEWEAEVAVFIRFWMFGVGLLLPAMDKRDSLRPVWGRRWERVLNVYRCDSFLKERTKGKVTMSKIINLKYLCAHFSQPKMDSIIFGIIIEKNKNDNDNNNNKMFPVLIMCATSRAIYTDH